MAKAYCINNEGVLLRQAKPPQCPMNREVVGENQVFDVVRGAHLELAHAGKNKTFHTVNRRYYGITKEEVSINQCMSLYL